MAAAPVEVTSNAIAMAWAWLADEHPQKTRSICGSYFAWYARAGLSRWPTPFQPLACDAEIARAYLAA